MINEILNWDQDTPLPEGPAVVAHDEFKALPPAEKVRVLNKLQSGWSDMLFVDDEKAYPGDMRDLERWFGESRQGLLKDSLAEDLRTGKLTEKQIEAFKKRDAAGLDDTARQYVQDRYGDPEALEGPWKTQKLPITGADGKQVGYQYIRRRSGLNGQSIAKNMGVPEESWNQAGYVQYNADPSNESPSLAWQNPDEPDNIEVAWTVQGNDGQEYSGVENVSAGEEFAKLADSQRSMAFYQGMGDPGMAGPSRELSAKAELPDIVGSEGLPAALAAEAVSERLRKRPEIAGKIGQGFWEGLPGEALKGFLTYGAAARYGPFALMGDKDALKEYEKAQDMLETDIEGQSKLGFRGDMSDKVLKGISAELPGMAFSMGASAGAAVVRKAVQTGARAAAAGLTLRGMTPAAAESIITSGGTRVGAQSGAQFAAQRAGQTTLNEGLAAGIARGVLTKITDKKSLIGKLIGTADLESKLVKNISDRVLTSVSFLPSAMRSGLDNMSTTLDAAEDLRKQGKTKEADALEESAMKNGWAGVFIELGSEAMWLNELMVTKAGRTFGDVATDVLGKKIGAGKLAQVTELFKRAVVGGNQEGIEEIVAGVGNRAWMNQFAGQNQDVFAGIDEEYLTGAALGGVISGIKAARDIAPEKAAMATEMLYRSVLGDQEAKAFVADVRARAEAQSATPATPSSEPPAAAVPVATPTPPVTPEPVAPETAPAPVSSAGPAVSPAPVTPAVPVPRAFAPIAPMPEERTPDEVARVLYDARADAVDVANDAANVEGARIAAEALASIAADEELPTADVESAIMAEPADVDETDFADIESQEEFDGTVDRIVADLKSGNRSGAMSVFSGLSAADIEKVTTEITGAGFKDQTRSEMLADLDNRLKFKRQIAREVFHDLDRIRASERAGRASKPISPDGDVATPSTETPAPPLAETAQEPAIAPAADSAATPEEDLKPGDEVTFTGKTKMDGNVSGILVETIKDQDGNTGYHILAPLPGDPGRTVRVWGTNGSVSVSKKITQPKESNPDESGKKPIEKPALRFNGPKQAGASLAGQKDAAYNGSRIATLRLLNEKVNAYPGETFDGIDPSQVDEVLDYMIGLQKPEEPTTETGRQVKEAFAGMASAATEGARRRVTELLDKGPYILENKAAGDAALANPDYRAERLPGGRVQITDVVNPDTGTWHNGEKAPAVVAKSATTQPNEEPTPPVSQEPIPAEGNWRIDGEWVKPKKVGQKWTQAEQVAIEQEFKDRGYSISRYSKAEDNSAWSVPTPPAGRGFRLIQGGSVRASKAVEEREQAKAEQAKADKDQERAAKQAAVESGIDPVAGEWIDRTFGADAMNAFNKRALSDYLTGKEVRFTGMVSPKWATGVEKSGARSGDAVDFAKLKASFESGNKSESKPAESNEKPSQVTETGSPLVEIADVAQQNAELRDRLDKEKPVSPWGPEWEMVTANIRPDGYAILWKKGKATRWQSYYGQGQTAESAPQAAPGAVPVTLNSPAGKAESNLTAEEIQDEIRENKFLETALKSLIDCLRSK